MNNICVITVYFGALPNYFPVWLQTVRYNPKVDFIMVTDAEVRDVPSNLKIVKTTLPKLKHDVSEKFGVQVALNNPYKLCDFKILYGVIFSDLLQGYGYWGHCDIDLVFGDLYDFFEKHEYQKYDKFLPLGHLSIYRNVKRVNEAYKLSGSKSDYLEVITSDDNKFFDEWDGLLRIYECHKELTFFDKRLFADISAIHKRWTLSKRDYSRKNYKYQVFYWQNGRAYRVYFDGNQFVEEEVAYIHYQKRKFLSCDNPRERFVLSESIHNTDEPIDMAFIEKYNNYNGFWVELSEELRFKSVYYCKKIFEKLRLSKS